MTLEDIRKEKEELRKRQEELESLEIVLKREELRKRGLLSSSLELLVCELHKDSYFIRVIGDDFFVPSVKQAVCYSCAETTLQKEISIRRQQLKDGLDEDLKIHFDKADVKRYLDEDIKRLAALREEKKFDIRVIFHGTKAYLCEPFLSKESGCGWVIGSPREEYHMSDPESWRALAGREGYVYHCIVCNGYLGDRWIRMS